MAQPPPLWDPFGVWRHLASRLESRLDRLASRGVSSDRFARAMHTALRACLSTRSVTDSLQNRLLQALNLPSRADIQALADRLQVIEDGLAALSAQARRLGTARESAAAPSLPAALPRTRKPPAPAPQAVSAGPRPALRRTRKAGR